MLIRAFFVVMILLLNIGCNIYAQEERTNVKGGFKECVIYKTEYKLGKLDNASRFKELHCYYDSTGKKTLELKYRPNNYLESKEYSYYNSDGRIHTVKGCNGDDSSKFQYYRYYGYDDNGNIIRSGAAHSDVRNEAIQPIFDKESFKFDKKGNIIEKIADKNVHHPLKFNYKYDKKGNQIEETIKSSDSSFFSRISNKYDKNRNIVEKIIYKKYPDREKANNQKFTYKYDSYGNITEEIRFLLNLKEPTEKREYIYFPNILNKVSK
ncbi:MAG: hypothetical protein WCR42_07735 [bacterium]